MAERVPTGLSPERRRDPEGVPDASTCIDGARGQSVAPATTEPGESYIRQLKAGERVGRFLLKSMIGQGGMGAVFLAQDPELQRDVAIKIIKPAKAKAGGARAQKRMLREAQAMAMVSHPNLAVIYEVGTFDETIFLAMEYVTGKPLSAWLRDDPPLEDIFDVFEQAGHALSAVHEAGLIHRDFKPDNVIVTPEGIPKVLDLGIARKLNRAARRHGAGAQRDDGLEETERVDDPQGSSWDESEPRSADASSDAELPGTALPGAHDALAAGELGGDAFGTALTREGAVVGTPAYMPPEQLLGAEVTEGVDQFALAVSMYEALAGQKPFSGRTPSQLLANILAGHLRPWPRDTDAPLALRRVVERALSAKVDERFGSVEEFLAACRHALGLRGQIRYLTKRWLNHDKRGEFLLSEGNLLEEGRLLLRDNGRAFTPEQAELINQSLKSADRKLLLRRSLLLGVGVLLLVLLLLGLYLEKSHRELDNAKRSAASEHALFVSDKVDDLVDNARARIELVFAQRRTWLPAAEQLFSPDNRGADLLAPAQALNDYFRPVIETSGGVSSLKLTRSDECEYLILEDPDAKELIPPYHFYNRVVVRQTLGDSAYEVFLPTAWEARPRTGWIRVGAPNSRGTLWTDYVPTQRLGFRLGSNRPQATIGWTQPYLFFTTKDPGITATVAFSHAGLLYVLGVDYLLTDVSELTRNLKSPDFWAVLVTASGRVLGVPQDPRFATSEDVRRFFSEFDERRRQETGSEKLGDRTAELPTIADLGIEPLTAALIEAPATGGRQYFTYDWDGEELLGIRAPLGGPELGLSVLVVERPPSR